MTPATARRAELPEGETMTEPIAERFLTYEQAAEFLSVSKSALYTLVSRKRIPFYRRGRIVRFRQSELERWLHHFDVEAA
jgi:excisionase family DNA binding protein